MFNLLLLFTVCLVLPGIAMAAGDDCPPPSDGGSDDYSIPGDDNDDTPAEAPSVEESDDDEGGVFGSLGSMSSGQLTIGILAVVGVIVGATYIVMVGRMDDDGEE